MTGRYAEADRYLASPDYSILLYSTVWERVNLEAEAGNQVILFTFSSEREILRWLRAEGQVNCERSCLPLATLEKAIASSGRRDHIDTVHRAKVNGKCVVLVIVCRNRDEAAILSITAIEKVTDPSLFEEFRARHPPSLYTLEERVESK